MKYNAWLAAVCLLLVCLSGCGKKEDNRIIKTPNFQIDDSVPENNSIRFSGLLGDNMVLQRETTVRLWGTGDTDGPVAVAFSGKTYFGECKNKKWEIYLEPQQAGGPFDFCFYSSEAKAKLYNVMFGDVYLCSGQSNMEMALGSVDEREDIAGSKNKNIRLLQVANNPQQEPVDEGSYLWSECTPNSAAPFSAAGYYFGKTLEQKLDIPIGLVMSAVGDTILCCWTPEPEASDLPKNYQGVAENIRRKPAYFYNGMIHPLRKYTFKGVLWYQGENQPENYDTMLVTMVKSWRREFENDRLKFVIIQLPRWGSGNDEMWYLSRENQKKAAIALTDATYSVNIDCGDEIDIHPKDKKIVGERAAYAALRAFYGAKEVFRGPVLKKYSVKGSSMVLEFSETGTGLKLKNGGKGFELWDGESYYPASAELKDGHVRVTSNRVKKPKGVRYAYGAFPEVSLYNNEGFPAEQFSTVKELKDE